MPATHSSRSHPAAAWPVRVAVLATHVLTPGAVSAYLAATTLQTPGRAAVVQLSGGRRFITLTSFSTSPGPDLRVRLVPGDSSDGGADGAA